MYKIQHIEFFEEASGLIVSINWENWSEKRLEVKRWGELRPPSDSFLEWPLISEKLVMS